MIDSILRFRRDARFTLRKCCKASASVCDITGLLNIPIHQYLHLIHTQHSGTTLCYHVSF